MADHAVLLLRTVARAFYPVEHVLVIDTLIIHGTLSDSDLAHVLRMNLKPLRKVCARLREDGLVTVQTRAERRTDGMQTFYPNSTNPRVTHKDWYYLNFHRAIDSIKFRMYRLNKHVESLGAPTTEKKDLACPRCKSQYTDLEALDNMDAMTGEFICKKCGHVLDAMEEDDRISENESMKRLNSQLEKIVHLMQQVDASAVPENDFQTALSNHIPIPRDEANPANTRTEVVDLPNSNLKSTKGMEVKPEKIAVQLDEESVKQESDAAELQARREKEARQNALPLWMLESTISGEVTAAGVKQERLRREREANGIGVKMEENGDEKKPAQDDEDAAMLEVYAQLARDQAARAAKEEEEDDEEDEEDEFEDIDVAGSTPQLNGNATDGTKAVVSEADTPALESSNATDDERDSKRVRVENPLIIGPSKSSNGTVHVLQNALEGTPAASDEDEEEIEFEDV